jgi:hypothetical protein
MRNFVLAMCAIQLVQLVYFGSKNWRFASGPGVPSGFFCPRRKFS